MDVEKEKGTVMTRGKEMCLTLEHELDSFMERYGSLPETYKEEIRNAFREGAAWMLQHPQCQEEVARYIWLRTQKERCHDRNQGE